MGSENVYKRQTYDVAFGLNWSGVINDERVATYGPQAAEEPQEAETAVEEEVPETEAAQEG